MQFNSPRFAIIAAVDAQLGIGRNGTLPWHLKSELAYFKRVTLEGATPDHPNVVIMGRHTWESLPKSVQPLPGRLNIVLSSQPLLLPEGVLSATSLPNAIDIATQNHANAVFAIGGQAVFEQAIQDPRFSTLYLTHIDKTFDCDTFFPKFEPSFTLKSKTDFFNENDMRYFQAVYGRVA